MLVTYFPFKKIIFFVITKGATDLAHLLRCKGFAVGYYSFNL
jgi:hypothetical protein